MVHKNIYLILLTTLFVAPLFGYSRVNIRNGTPYKVDVHVGYRSCNSDDWTVQPNSEQSAPTGRGACLVTNINCTVHEELTEGKIVKKQVDYNSPGSGGSNWVIAGPLYDGNKNSYYTIE